MSGYEYEEEHTCYDYEIEEHKTLPSSGSKTNMFMESSVSVKDLEHNVQYEIQWHMRNEVKCVVAEFDRKIGHNNDEYDEFDLVFKHVITGNTFVIHSDLIDEGMIVFMLLS